MDGFPLPNHQYFTTKMNVSAHETENARFRFFARIIYIAKDYQWFENVILRFREFRSKAYH